MQHINARELYRIFNFASFKVSCVGKIYNIEGERSRNDYTCWNCSFPNMTTEMIAECITSIFTQNEYVMGIEFTFFKAQYLVRREFGDTFEDVMRCIEEQKHPKIENQSEVA